MSNMLCELLLKDKGYYGKISVELNKENEYQGLCLMKRNSEKVVYCEVKSVPGGVEFEIDCRQKGLNNGIWDAYLVNNKKECIAIKIKRPLFPRHYTIYSIETILYVSRNKMFIPMISADKHLIFKIGPPRNNKIGHDIIYITDFDATEDRLTLKGVQWPTVRKCEIYLVVESSDFNIRRLIPVRKKSDLSYEIDKIKEMIFTKGSYTRWNIWIEINTGSMYMKYMLKLKDNFSKGSIFMFEADRHYKSDHTKGLMFLARLGAELKFVYGDKEEQIEKYTYALLEDFKMKNKVIEITGKISSTKVELLAIRLIPRDVEDASSCDLDLLNVRTKGKSQYFETKIDLRQLTYESLNIDAFLVIQYEGKEVLLRLKNNSAKVNLDLNKRTFAYCYRPTPGFIVFPYISNYNGFTIMYRKENKYDGTYMKSKEILAIWIYGIAKRWINRKQIWLICEKFAQTAQDNSYFFFEYCYKNHKEKKVYYIIDKKAPDYAKLIDKKDRVIQFMSLKHLIFLNANVILISSEHRIHYYPWRSGRGRIRNMLGSKPYVFLQHGVIAFKKVDISFRKSIINANLFVTSSDFEKSIILEHYGYQDEEVIVTGLARWDVIENKAPRDRKEIVLMPTWRKWIGELSEQNFLKSDYFLTYSELIQNKKLAELAQKYNFVVNFIIHPKLKQHVSNFSTDSDYINVYQFEDAPINELLMRASMLVTDYSSVGWETYYSKKPVVFYRFDIEMYEELQGAHIDLREDVIGEVTTEVPKLLEVIESYAKTGFVEKEKYTKDRLKYFKYMDRENSKRIFDEIEKYKY